MQKLLMGVWNSESIISLCFMIKIWSNVVQRTLPSTTQVLREKVCAIWLKKVFRGVFFQRCIIFFSLWLRTRKKVINLATFFFAFLYCVVTRKLWHAAVLLNSDLFFRWNVPMNANAFTTNFGLPMWYNVQRKTCQMFRL